MTRLSWPGWLGHPYQY